MHRLFVISCLLITIHSTAQSTFGYQQYSFVGVGQPLAPMPIAHYESGSKWYTEARYNYDEWNTFSINTGKTFSSGNDVTYSLTPMVGAMAGTLVGGSVSLNTDINYSRINFSSQSQYSFSAQTNLDNYFYSWAEISYQPLSWVYAGLSLQHTHARKSAGIAEPGFLLGFTYKEWTFPLYSFNSFTNQRYFIVGFCYELQKIRKQKTPETSVVLNR
jgi:hypothetical protein